jgi:hypothetical protein
VLTADSSTCMEYGMTWGTWLIWCAPVIPALWGWLRFYRNRRVTPPTLAPAIALVCFTACATLSAAGTLYLAYFACVPSSTPWQLLPEFRLDACVIILAVASLISGFIALARGHSKLLFGIVLLASGWLFTFSVLHAITI